MEFHIGSILFNETSPPRFIAEIGTAHQGDLVKAKELICAAKEAGADFAKFQHVIADEIIHPETGLVPLPSGPTPLYEVFKSLQQPIEFFAELKEYCIQTGIEFLCSPFGIKSARELKSINVHSIKIASPELNHFPLLHEVDSYNIPVLLSTGVSKLTDIENALDILNSKPVLLHCVTSYPAPEEEYNVSVIKNLSEIFGCLAGVSDHSLHPYLVPAVSALFDAKIIEKHITLSKSDFGLDDPIALTPNEFSQMTSFTKNIIQFAKVEIFKQLYDEFGNDRIHAIIGSGEKKLAKSERLNYGRTNRSLHALKFLHKGESLCPENVGILRTEKQLRPGLSPLFFKSIIGATVTTDIPAGEGIRLEDLLLQK